MTKFILGKSLYIEIKIGEDDIDLYLNPGNTEGIYLIQNRKLTLPVLEVILNDVNGEIESEYPLYDGVPIKVTFGSNDLNEVSEEIDFRIFGAPKTAPNGSKTQIKISALLDAPKFLTDLPKQAFQGSSSSVITRLAEICGLIADVDKTDDSQNWVPLNKTFANFVNSIATNGWVNNTSLMLTAITERKNLKYYNVSNRILNKVDTSFNYGVLPDENFKFNIDCTEYEIRNSNGFTNNYIGYSLRLVEEELSGNATLHNDIFATKQSNFFEMNKDIKNSILENPKYEYTPVNCGNVHPNYIKAYYQNRRLKSVYSTFVDVIAEETTNIELYDIINLNLVDKTTKTNNLLFKGNYIITAKTRAVVGPRYFEKFQLQSTGRNINVKDKLI